MTAAYPLTWPPTIPRATRREAGQFKTTLAGALGNVQGSLRRFGSDSGKAVGSIVLSSNVTLGVDRPADPGVAVWFTWDGMQVCIPVDRYQTPAAILQAIHHIIEARRVELRHGTLALVRASFTGFQALPGPAAQTWRDVLGNPKTLAEAEAAFRERAKSAHPDRGGSAEQMAALNLAIAQARKEISV